jgi:hypothetical protein
MEGELRLLEVMEAEKDVWICCGTVMYCMVFNMLETFYKRYVMYGGGTGGGGDVLCCSKCRRL